MLSKLWAGHPSLVLAGAQVALVCALAVCGRYVLGRVLTMPEFLGLFATVGTLGGLATWSQVSPAAKGGA